MKYALTVISAVILLFKYGTRKFVKVKISSEQPYILKRRHYRTDIADCPCFHQKNACNIIKCDYN